MEKFLVCPLTFIIVNISGMTLGKAALFLEYIQEVASTKKAKVVLCVKRSYERVPVKIFLAVILAS